jgi:ribosomal protein S18 acetylase RimI-like enzyme
LALQSSIVIVHRNPKIKMPLPTIRNFSKADIPQIMALQRLYWQAYPHASVIPGEVYLSPGFEDGANIFCAFDGWDDLMGYAPLLPVIAEQPGRPHVAWAEVKTDPGLGPWPLAKNFLFQRVVRRAGEIAEAFPGHGIRLTFQYHPSERASIEYVTSRGCQYSVTVFRMMRELTSELPEAAKPDGIVVRRWKMETEAEQQAYVCARNDCFPENPVALGDWQSFLRSPAWCDGAAITAFDGEEIAGSVAAYPNEAVSQHTGRKAADTEFVFVRPAWRRRGIAAYLVAESLRYLKHLGCEAAFLEVSAANESALDLYRRLGYEVVDQTGLYTLEL